MSEAVIMKALASVEGGDATDEYPHGSFDVILSAPTLDRDNEVVEPKAFDPLPDHVTFDIDHGMTVAKTVGSGRPFYDEQGRLRVKGGFASTPLAQEVRALVKEGHIRSTSVTFLSADRTRDAKGVTHVQKAELLNGTFASVPVNREALVLSSKQLERKAGARNNADDGSRLQQIHDLAVENGAACSGMKAIGRKAIVGSVEALQDRAIDVLGDTYGGNFLCLRGVLPDRLVFDMYEAGEGVESYSQTYTDDGQVVTLTGNATVVDIQEIVTPDADAATEPPDDVPATEDAEGAAGTAAKAAVPAAPSASPLAGIDDIEARRRLVSNVGNVLTFGAA